MHTSAGVAFEWRDFLFELIGDNLRQNSRCTEGTGSFCFVDDLIEELLRSGTMESAPDEVTSLENEHKVTIA
jgi:hypothetical protein